MGKTGLVVEGGGMKCAYSAGVLDVFLDNKITFDYGIGVSAGAACLASFEAGQRDRNLRFYTEHIDSPEYFGMKSLVKTGNLFGLDYIYSTLTNSTGDDPLDFPVMRDNPMEYYAVATCAETGKPVYFSKDTLSQDDYRQIKASCALPVVCRPIEIDGQHFYDGGVTDSIPVQKALDDGCEKLVVIQTKPRDFVKKPEGHRPAYTLFCHRYPETVRALNHRHIMYKQCQDKMFELEKEGKAFLFNPDGSLKMSTYNMDRQVEQELYDMGVRDARSSVEELKKFLS